MNVVDSSGWLEFFADAENADFFSEAIEDTENLVVPTLSIYEVFSGCSSSVATARLCMRSPSCSRELRLTDLTVSLAISAADVGVRERLPLADSVILATARAFDATLWTQDSDFAEIEGVAYTPKVYD